MSLPVQCVCVCVCGAYACVCVCVCTGAALVRSFTVLFGLRTVCHLFQCKWLCGVHRLPIPQQRSHFGMCDGWQGKPLPKRPRTLAALGNRVGQRPSSQQSPGGPLSPSFSLASRLSEQRTPKTAAPLSATDPTQNRTKPNLVINWTYKNKTNKTSVFAQFSGSFTLPRAPSRAFFLSPPLFCARHSS